MWLLDAYAVMSCGFVGGFLGYVLGDLFCRIIYKTPSNSDKSSERKL